MLPRNQYPLLDYRGADASTADPARQAVAHRLARLSNAAGSAVLPRLRKACNPCPLHARAEATSHSQVRRRIAIVSSFMRSRTGNPETATQVRAGLCGAKRRSYTALTRE